VFEPTAMARRDTRAPARTANPRLLFGGAVGALLDGTEDARMDYAVLDLGAEKLVARYVGNAEGMAINESVLRESLLSLGGRLLAGGDAPLPVDRLAWEGGPGDAGPSFVALPAGWVVEPGRPSVCQALAPPDRTLTASPVQDFTRVMRAALWSGDGIDPVAASAACSARRGSLGEASYALRDSWLGVTYTVEGVFVRAGQKQVLQLEVVSTDRSAAYARDLLAAWVKKSAG
jgi:hypothetical protein